MISFITHSRDQNEILKYHISIWDKFPDAVLEKLEFILIDDCSQEPISIRRPYLKIARSLDNMQWNYGVKNLGVTLSNHNLILITGLDHLLTLEAANKLIEYKYKPQTAYKISRFNKSLPMNSRYNDRPHIGTVLMYKSDFLNIGGFDEDFSGEYGHDDTFLWDCLFRNGFNIETLSHIRLENYSKSSQFSDADFVDNKMRKWSRDTVRNTNILRDKRKRGVYLASRPMIRFKWKHLDE